MSERLAERTTEAKAAAERIDLLLAEVVALRAELKAIQDARARMKIVAEFYANEYSLVRLRIADEGSV